jgi:hypothetical protein
VTNFNLDLTKERQAAMMIEGIPVSLDHPLGNAVRRVRIMLLDRVTNEVNAVHFGGADHRTLWSAAFGKRLAGEVGSVTFPVP